MCQHKMKCCYAYRCVSTFMKMQKALLRCVNKSAPPPVISFEHPYPRPPFSKDHLECPVYLDILTQPMELPCCAQCIIHWVRTTGSVHCPCCCSCEAMHIKPVSNLVILMLKDVLVHCTICTRDMRAGIYEHHECTPT